MPIKQPATCDACNARGVEKAPTAEFAVSELAPGLYNEEERYRGATLLCGPCFELAGGPHQFSDKGWKPLGKPPRPRPTT